jgi:hypothetical protein
MDTKKRQDVGYRSLKEVFWISKRELKLKIKKQESIIILSFIPKTQP